MKPENIKIFISKSKKHLKVFSNRTCLHTFVIGLGKDPVGTKQREGDYKTPEGVYQICVKNPNSKYLLSLGLNYPNKIDAQLGLERGDIDLKTYDQICTAIDHQQIPPWKTILGGEIFIHGHLEECDWSRGCIRMYNADIKVLYALAEKGMPVFISA